MSDQDVALGKRAPWSKWASAVGFVIGLAALAAAVWVVLGNESALRDAWGSVRGAPLWMMTLLVVLPVVDWAVVTLSFHALTRRYGRVGLGEMGALIGSAWLLNYLPLRAGMVGRVAYHKTVNGIRVVDSIAVMMWGVGLSVAAMAVLFALAWLPMVGVPDTVAVAVGGVPLVAAVVLAFSLSGGAGLGSGLVLAFGCRYADALCWAARYWVVFAVVGQPISATEAAVLAAVTQVIGLIPVAGNGLGVREWAVAATNGLWGGQTETGLAADLLSRAGELIVVVPLGVVSTLIVARLLARRGRPGGPGEPGPTEDAPAG